MFLARAFALAGLPLLAQAVSFRLEQVDAGASPGAVEDLSPAERMELMKREATTLELIVEQKFETAFADAKNITKWEASAVTFAKGAYYVVFDNLHGFAEVRNIWGVEGNIVVGEPGSDSGYEGMAYDKHEEIFHFLIEATKTRQGVKPVVQELNIIDHGGRNVTYDHSRKCPVHFEVQAENKGLEGMLLHYNHAKGKKVLFGLCEGNHCQGGKKGRERGNGRIVVAEYAEDGEDCAWDLHTMWHLPGHVMFKDYSGIAFDGYRMAITSQEDAMVWVVDADLNTRTFSGPGRFYQFPKDDEGRTIYCNVEGINLLGRDTIVVVSDKKKGHGKQPAECADKDQSIHLFTIPDN